MTLALLTLSAVAAFAALPSTEVVYVANFAKSNIVRVNFDTGTTEVINKDANKLKKLSALLVINTGTAINILVCDTGASNLVLYSDVNGAGFTGIGSVIASFPAGDLDGISADASGNLYVVSRTPGKKKGKWDVSTLARGSTGYGPPVVIVGGISSDELEDTKVVRTTAGKLVKNDLLVVSESPARVLHYRKTGATWAPATNPFDPPIPSHTDPEALGFSSDAQGLNVLVTTDGGDVLRYDANGGALSNFVSGLGNGTNRIAVGFQGGQNRAFVTQRNGHNVYAIDILANGTGNPVQSVSQGLTYPDGVSLANGSTSAFLPTSASADTSFDSQDTTFNQVKKAGVADLTCRLLPTDPREYKDAASCRAACDGYCQGSFCKRDLRLSELDPSFSGDRDVMIAWHVRSLRIGDPVTGSPQFFFCQGKTTAQFKFASSQVHESQFLNRQPPNPPEPSCTDPITANRSMFFWSPIPLEEPTIFEHHPRPRFINLSTGCADNSSNRGDVDDYSIMLPAARETLPFCKVADDGLEGLEGALEMPELANFIPAAVRGQLRDKQEDAEEAFEGYVHTGHADKQALAKQRLDEFIAIVEAYLAAIDNAAAHRNVSGELIVRARSARYIIDQVTPALLNPCRD